MPDQKKSRREADSPTFKSKQKKNHLPAPVARTTAQIGKLTKFSNKRLEVLGCPGAGKTQLLVDRCNYLVETKGIRQSDIAVMTFANSTVATMKTRLKEVGLEDIKVRTCHSAALRILKNNVESRDEVALCSRLRSVEREKLIQTIAAGILDSALADKTARAMGKLFEKTALTCQPIEELIGDADFAGLGFSVAQLIDIQEKFKEHKATKGKWEFADLPVQAAAILNKKGSEVPKLKHLLVDEYQDCSPSQVQFIAALGLRIPNIFVVGDARQNVYGFGGSRYTPLAEVLSGVKSRYLLLSRRLTEQNAALADAVMPPPDGLNMGTAESGVKPVIVVGRSESEQTHQITAEIKALIESGVDETDIAVLGRRKYLIGVVESALRSVGVNVRRIGDDFDPKHVRRVIRLMYHFDRVVNGKPVPPDFFSARLRRWAVTSAKLKVGKKELYSIKTPSLEGRFQSCARIYLSMLGGSRKNVRERDGINRSVALCRMAATPRDLRVRLDALNRSAAVTTSTIHSAKGREWKYVFIVGATDGELPIVYARTEVQIEEEKRLTFVALTRASVCTRLFHSASRNTTTRSVFKEMSRFLIDACKEGVLDMEKGKVRGRTKGEPPEQMPLV